MYEIRAFQTNLGYIAGLLEGQKKYTLAIGSEQCSIHFLEETSSLLLPKRFTLVTPKTDVIHFEAVVRRIDELCTKFEIESIVVNDWGILQWIYDNGYVNNIIAGRVLFGSYGYKESLTEFIHPDEREDIVKNITAPSAIHRSKVKLLERYGVKAVEVCWSEKEDVFIPILKVYGIRVHLHLGTFLAALSKTCYKTLRLEDGRVGCSIECNYADLLKLEYIDGYNPLDKNSISEKDYMTLLASFKDYYLMGNAIYRLCPSTCCNLSLYDCIIIDSRLSYSALSKQFRTQC